MFVCLSRVLNIITQPSIKHLSTSLFVFKENSIPAWEHESNENAGRWIIILDEGCNLHITWNDMVYNFKITVIIMLVEFYFLLVKSGLLNRKYGIGHVFKNSATMNKYHLNII